MVTNTMFPKIVLPAITAGTCLLDNLMLFISLLIIFALLGHVPNANIIWLPLLILSTAALSVGVGLILGIFNVFIRDIAQVVPIILQIMFWFTPIVYPLSIIPESYRHYLYFNPMYPLVKAYQNVLVFGTAPDTTLILIVTLFSAGLLLLGFFLFMRANEEMADAL